MKKAALYARYSTDLQKEASIEDQFRECGRIADTLGLEVVDYFSDAGFSGGTSYRPGYQALLKAAREKKFEIVVVEDISRLWRNRADYGTASAELEDLNVHLVTCVGDDTRRDGYGLVLGIKSAIAEHQRREISYRTRRGLEGRALKGWTTGGRCYGFGTGSCPGASRTSSGASSGTGPPVWRSTGSPRSSTGPASGRPGASTGTRTPSSAS